MEDVARVSRGSRFERQRKDRGDGRSSAGRLDRHFVLPGLRGGGLDGALDAFLDGLDPEFADELRQALEQVPAPRRMADA